MVLVEIVDDVSIEVVLVDVVDDVGIESVLVDAVDIEVVLVDEAVVLEVNRVDAEVVPNDVLFTYRMILQNIFSLIFKIKVKFEICNFRSIQNCP